MSKPPRLPTSPRPVAESARSPYDRVYNQFSEDRKTNLRGRLPVLILTQSPPVCPTSGNSYLGRTGKKASEACLPVLVPSQSPPVLPYDGNFIRSYGLKSIRS